MNANHEHDFPAIADNSSRDSCYEGHEQTRRPTSENSAGHSYGNSVISGGRVQLGNIYYNINHNTIRSRVAGDDIPASPSVLSHTQSFKHTGHIFFVPTNPATYFTGRRLQLEKLQTLLHSSADPARKIVVVEGLGGSGKTQFCLKFADMHRNDYEGIFWIDASSQKSAENSYAELGMLFGKGNGHAAGKYWLTKAQRPWLLILDNADSVDLELTSLMPTSSSGHIIITSRNRSVTEHANAGVIRLTRMDPEEAVDLLLTSAYPNDPESKTQPQRRTIAGSIAARLDYLAIAVRQAGSAIRRNIYTLEKYLSSYLGHRIRLLPQISQLTASVDVNDADTITTWEIPFGRMQNRKNDRYQDAVSLLHVLACLHHIPVHEKMLAVTVSTNLAQHTLEELPDLFSRRAEMQEESELRFRLALELLYDYSVVELDHNTISCSIHPVVHNWVRYRIKQQGHLVQWLKCTAHVLASISIDENAAQTSPPAFSLVPHLDSFLRFVHETEPALMQNPTGCAQLEQFAKFYERAGQWQRSLDVLRTVMAFRTATFGPYHNDTLRVKRNVSLCYWNLFEVGKAIEIQAEIRAARWKHRSSLFDWINPIRPMHTEYLVALSDLTQTLWLAGQHSLSRLAGERATNGLSNALGRDNQLTVDAMFNLGRTYRHIGLLVEAHNLLLHALRWRKKNLGLNHVDTLMVRNEVGMSLYAQKRHLAQAERILQNVLEARQEILGDEHAYTLWSVNDLAKMMTVRGRPAEAARLLEEIIPAIIRTLGSEHVGMQMTKGNLAKAYALCKEWAKAERFLAEIIPLMDKAHPDWAHSMVGYARIQIRQQKLDLAEQTCNTITDVMTKAAPRAKSRDFLIIVAGLKAEICRRSNDSTGLATLRKQLPTLDEHIMDRDFELT